MSVQKCIYLQCIITEFNEPTRTLKGVACNDFTASYMEKKGHYVADSGIVDIYVPYNAYFYESQRNKDFKENSLVYEFIGKKCALTVKPSLKRINLVSALNIEP